MPIDVQGVLGKELDESHSKRTETEHMLYALGLGIGIVKYAKVTISS